MRDGLHAVKVNKNEKTKKTRELKVSKVIRKGPRRKSYFQRAKGELLYLFTQLA